MPVVKTHAKTLCKQVLEILKKTVVDEISGGLKSIVNVVVGLGVVDTNTQSVLHLSLIEEVREILRGSGVVAGMSDIIGTSARVLVVRTLDIVSTHILSFRAEGLCGNVVLTSLSGFAAVFDVFETATVHVECKLHVVVDGVVDGFDAVRVVDGEFRVVGSLDGLVNDTVSDTEGVEVELDTGNGSVGDKLVLVVEVIEERRSCDEHMSAIRPEEAKGSAQTVVTACDYDMLAMCFNGKAAQHIP